LWFLLHRRYKSHKFTCTGRLFRLLGVLARRGEYLCAPTVRAVARRLLHSRVFDSFVCKVDGGPRLRAFLGTAVEHLAGRGGRSHLILHQYIRVFVQDFREGDLLVGHTKKFKCSALLRKRE
jgi:hypothetical protein